MKSILFYIYIYHVYIISEGVFKRGGSKVKSICDTLYSLCIPKCYILQHSLYIWSSSSINISAILFIPCQCTNLLNVDITYIFSCRQQSIYIIIVLCLFQSFSNIQEVYVYPFINCILYLYIILQYTCNRILYNYRLLMRSTRYHVDRVRYWLTDTVGGG